MHLEMVNHTVRTKLDEIKRSEVTRLRDLARMQMEAAQGTDLIMNALSEHVVAGGNKTYLPISIC